jgi:hypothetical protein
MLEAIYIAIGAISAIAMFIDDRSQYLLMRLFMASLVFFAWPFFFIAIPLGEYIKNKSKKTTTSTNQKPDEKVVIACLSCGQKLRIPKGKLLDVKCARCSKEWREQY